MYNFVVSVNNCVLVMDYLYLYIVMNCQGKMDFSKSYDVGIGDWDKCVIIYGY